MPADSNFDLRHRARVLLNSGRYAEAAPLLERRLEELRRERAESAPPTHAPEVSESSLVHEDAEGSESDDDFPRIKLVLPRVDPQAVRDTEYATALQSLAICYMELRRTADARALLDEAIRVAPSPVLRGKLLHELALLCQQQGDLEAAIRHCRQGIDLELEGEGEPFKSLQTLAVLYQMTRRFDEAREMLELVRESCESRLDFEYLGMALRELGRAAFLSGEVGVAAGFFSHAGSLERRAGNKAGAQMSGMCLEGCAAVDPSLRDRPALRGFFEGARTRP